MHGVVFWRDLSADFPAVATALPSAAQACICEQFLSSPADHVAIRQGYSLLILQLNYRKACRHAREVLAELLRNCGHKTDFKKKSPGEFSLVVPPKTTNNHCLHTQKQADSLKSSLFTHSPAFFGSVKPQKPRASEKGQKLPKRQLALLPRWSASTRVGAFSTLHPQGSAPREASYS